MKTKTFQVELPVSWSAECAGDKFPISCAVWTAADIGRLVQDMVDVLLQRAGAGDKTDAARKKSRAAKAEALSRGEWKRKGASDPTLAAIKRLLMNVVQGITPAQADELAVRFADCEEAAIPAPIRAGVMACRGLGATALDVKALGL